MPVKHPVGLIPAACYKQPVTGKSEDGDDIDIWRLAAGKSIGLRLECYKVMFAGKGRVL